MHKNLQIIKEQFYDTCGFEFTNLSINAESLEYGACTFKLNGRLIQYRVSKITPTKTGQFVTIWKRNKNGITEPFDSKDDFDFIIITSISDENSGQFIFPKSILIEKGIITSKGKKGKRGIRVYPPWNKTTSEQAEKTQKWQINYFVHTTTNQESNCTLFKSLLAIK
ncbi:MAG: MepB family protein [Bacteroidetes bacterium]|nr:MepB family protein [Bacteroidota bacterium]